MIISFIANLVVLAMVLMMIIMLMIILAIILKLRAVCNMTTHNRAMKKMTITLKVCVCITRVFAFHCVILI